MSNINLNLVEEEAVRKEPAIFGTGLISSIALLVIAMIAYGTLIFFNKSTSAKIRDVDSQYQAEYRKFLSGNANEIIDFKNRSEMAKKFLDTDHPMNEALAQVESSILPSVYLESLDYERDKNTLSLSGVADNFNTLAKQILSFKRNDYFSSVIPGQGTIKEQNKLIFSVNLKIK